MGDYMLAKIQKWGNSQGIRLKKSLLADAQIDVGDDVNIQVKDGTLIVTPEKRIRDRHKIEDLVARIPKGYQNREVGWGKPTGREVW
jgi:antitoxin MazE